MEEKRISPLKAIRLKCLDCCGSAYEAKLCTVEKCPLHLFRLGKNPNRTGIGGNGYFGAKQCDSTTEFSEISLSGSTYMPGYNSEEISNRTEDI